MRATLKSTDLRCGNTVYGFDGNPTTVEAADLIAMVQCELAGTPIEFVRPIELTEDWLLRAGAEKNGPYASWKLTLDDKTSLIVCLDGDAWIEIEDDRVEPLKHVQSDIFYLYHVHSLQNFIHSRTGNELLIKEKV